MMYKLMRRRITSTALDKCLGWVIGFLFLVICTTLVLKMLPMLGLFTGAVLVLCVSVGWLVIACEAHVLS